ncbi:hypothetical protein BC831DRAFT_123336 [Entophlyctis helioformis]|nr:hypothetical protein BC831DRAFT_123336 [Entophlyctis helioformis]
MSSLTLLEHDCAVLQRIWPDTFPKSLSCCYLKDSPALCLDGRVTKLTMNFGRGNTTDNAVPNDIAALTGLKTLQLGNNGYTSIPDGVFDNLTALEWLDLYGNNFGGKPIPSSIGNLANLVDLNFGYSGVGGEIPRSLEKLDKLYFLNLNGNTLTGVIPPGFSNLKSLHTL